MQSVQAAQLLRKKQVAELLQIAMSTLCSWLQEGGRYYKPLFPRPIYIEGSRTPFWRLTDIQEFVAANDVKPLIAVEPKTVSADPKASEIVESTSQSKIEGDDHSCATSTKSAGFQEFVLKGGVRVRVRTGRRDARKVEASTAMLAGIESSVPISHSARS